MISNGNDLVEDYTVNIVILYTLISMGLRSLSG